MSESTYAIPPKSLLRKVGRAIADYQMIRDGDRLLLGVSGGKDSLALLQVLMHLKTYAPVKFALGVTWHYQQQPIMEDAKQNMSGDSFCSYCSRMKRGIMYSTCREHNYNVLVLAQHLDDLAESFIMSAFHQGRLGTMKAHYTNDAGDVRIIRPLAYVRETMTAAFSKEAQLPIIPDS